MDRASAPPHSKQVPLAIIARHSLCRLRVQKTKDTAPSCHIRPLGQGKTKANLARMGTSFRSTRTAISVPKWQVMLDSIVSSICCAAGSASCLALRHSCLSCKASPILENGLDCSCPAVGPFLAIFSFCIVYRSGSTKATSTRPMSSEMLGDPAVAYFENTSRGTKAGRSTLPPMR